MFSSLEIPSGSSSESHQYHANAFKMHSNAITGASGPNLNSNESVKLTTKLSTDASSKQSHTIFNFNNNNNSNRNKFGACNSTCSNNNFDNVKHNDRSTMYNEKM